MSLYEFQSEYKISEGKSIQYHDFGHPDIFSFLKSIPDTLTVSKEFK